MMQVLLTGLICGILIGAALAWTRADSIRTRTDQKLHEENEYLRKEVTRLRAQVALHINQELSRPAAYPANLNTTASTVGAR